MKPESPQTKRGSEPDQTLRAFIEQASRYLFFTGKGGVGKTTLACATAVARTDQGKRVLLVSTDPASNLDEVLGQSLNGAPTPIPNVNKLWALNIDPDAAAHAYRERTVGPYRGRLPEALVRSMEEQLSGACTTEIASFDEVAKLLGVPGATAEYDHVLFDTAPTGHTLRLLSLPTALTGFLNSNTSGTSCLGPLGGLALMSAVQNCCPRFPVLALTPADEWMLNDEAFIRGASALADKPVVTEEVSVALQEVCGCAQRQRTRNAWFTARPGIHSPRGSRR